MKKKSMNLAISNYKKPEHKKKNPNNLSKNLNLSTKDFEFFAKKL